MVNLVVRRPGVGCIAWLGLLGPLVSPLYHGKIESVTEKCASNSGERMLRLAEAILASELRLAHGDATVGKQRDDVWQPCPSFAVAGM